MKAVKVTMFLALLVNHCNAQAPASPANLSDADEMRVGKILAEKFIQEEGLAPTPQIVKIEGYLQSVGDKLAAHVTRKLAYTFHFDPDPSFKSAFALPGGQIFVGGGVLAMMDSEDQLAVVLGHEMEHVDLNQCHDRLVEQLTKQKLTLATVGDTKVDPFLPGYGHDKEMAADREGGKLAASAGYSPQAAVRLLKMYVLLGQQLPGNPSEAESRLKERISAFEKLIADEKLPTPKEKPLALP